MEEFSVSKTHLVLLRALIGALVGVFVMLFNPISGNNVPPFNISGGTLAWFTLNIIVWALYLTLTFPLWKTVRTYRRYFRGQVILAIVILSVLVTLPDVLIFIFVPDVRPVWLTDFRIKFPIITTIGFLLVSLPAAVVIWLIQIALRQEFQEGEFNSSHLEKYIRLHDDLTMMIFLIGLTIGLLMLTAGAARQADIDFSKTINYPAVWLAAYGGYFTLLLVFIFVPVQWSLNAFGQKICQTMAPLPDVQSPDWSNAYSKQKSLEALMHISSNDPRNWQTSLALIVPLFSALIPGLLSGK